MVNTSCGHDCKSINGNEYRSSSFERSDPFLNDLFQFCDQVDCPVYDKERLVWIVNVDERKKPRPRSRNSWEYLIASDSDDCTIENSSHEAINTTSRNFSSKNRKENLIHDSRRYNSFEKDEDWDLEMSSAIYFGSGSESPAAHRKASQTLPINNSELDPVSEANFNLNMHAHVPSTSKCKLNQKDYIDYHPTIVKYIPHRISKEQASSPSSSPSSSSSQSPSLPRRKCKNCQQTFLSPYSKGGREFCSQDCLSSYEFSRCNTPEVENFVEDHYQPNAHADEQLKTNGTESEFEPFIRDQDSERNLTTKVEGEKHWIEEEIQKYHIKVLVVKEEQKVDAFSPSWLKLKKQGTGRQEVKIKEKEEKNELLETAFLLDFQQKTRQYHESLSKKSLANYGKTLTLHLLEQESLPESRFQPQIKNKNKSRSNISRDMPSIDKIAMNHQYNLDITKHRGLPKACLRR